MAQGRFMVGAAHKSRLKRSRGKNNWPRRHFHNEAPQALSNKLSPASRQRSGWVGTAPMNPRCHSKQTIVWNGGSKERSHEFLKRSTKCHERRLTLGLVPERIFMRHISDKIKERWHPTKPHHTTTSYTSKSPVQEQANTHLPLDSYQVEEESLYLFLIDQLLFI